MAKLNTPKNPVASGLDFAIYYPSEVAAMIQVCLRAEFRHEFFPTERLHRFALIPALPPIGCEMMLSGCLDPLVVERICWHEEAPTIYTVMFRPVVVDPEIMPETLLASLERHGWVDSQVPLTQRMEPANQ